MRKNLLRLLINQIEMLHEFGRIAIKYFLPVQLFQKKLTSRYCYEWPDNTYIRKCVINVHCSSESTIYSFFSFTLCSIPICLKVITFQWWLTLFYIELQLSHFFRDFFKK